MNEDALNTFPQECCGFFFGHEDGEDRYITSWLQAANNSSENQRRRFSISSKDYLDAENYAFENNLSFLGIYHSHPDHPAIPSEHDRVAAQPFFSYVIISVSENRVAAIRSWRLNDEHQFEEEQLIEIIHHQ